MSKRRLGKGIDALLQGRDLEQLESLSSIVNVPIDKIHPNPNQPRKHFDPATLKELADSIKEKGIIQPIIAEDTGDGIYMIIAGERRFRAAQMVGLDEVPVIPNEFSEEEKLEIALIENLQREDLNPIDEALALKSMMDQVGLTQEQVAQRLGLSRPAVANTLRLLRLSQEIQDALSSGTLSAGHARALLAVRDDEARNELFHRIVNERLSVRDAELAARGPNGEPGSVPTVKLPADELEVPAAGATARSGDESSGAGKPVELKQIEQQLITALGTKVVVKGSNSTGRIEIAYFSMEDLERVVEIISGPLGS